MRLLYSTPPWESLIGMQIQMLPDYFYAASLNQYRDGGAGTIQGMFSLRFTDDGALTLFDEDSNG